jgi:hypothetical protein
MIFGLPERPSVCSGFKADYQVCGTSSEEALNIIGRLEIMTS